MPPQRSHGAPDLDSWLAELDGRLLAIQADLIPGRGGDCSADGGESDAEVGVAAGPFANTDAVRAFGRAVSALPGVSEVTLRAYAGATRAVFDVQLS